MKHRNLIKKLSLFLAALLILTALPWASVSANAAKGDPLETKAGVIPQAIWTEGDLTLTFVCESTEYKAGDTFRGQTVTEVWNGTRITASSMEGPAWEGTVDEMAEKVVFEESFSIVRPTIMTGWFRYFVELTEITGISNLNTSEVTDMSDMFRSCNSLESLDLSSFNTSKVTSMGNMFTRCYELTSLDLSHFDTSKVQYMQEMFSGCTELTILDISGFDASKVITAAYMFANCPKLEKIFCADSDSKWTFASENTTEVLFAGNSSLKGLYGATVIPFGLGREKRDSARSAKLSGLFTPKRVRISFAGNEGNGSMDPVEAFSSFYSAEQAVLPANTFEREGYRFTGWNTEADGSGTAYADKVQFSVSEDLTLYAQWEEVREFWTRLAGANRFDTMEKVLQEAYEDASCTSLVVASGMDYADALTGASLAGALECPIVLTSDVRLLPYTKNEIERLAAPGCKVYVLGGTAAVSESVFNQIENLTNVASVKRIAGANREQTALEVLKEGQNTWGETVILATGMDYADTLAISPYAYAAKTPILLGRGKGNIGPEIEEALMSDRFKKVVIVGGTGAINAAVETRLQEAGKQVVRLAGGNRFETALNVARWELGMDAEAAFQPEVEMKADGMGIATGMDFADALGSVSLLGKTKSVLALTLNPAGARQLVTNMVNELIVPNVPVMEKGYIFGGTGAVSEEIEALLNEAVQ